MHQEQDHTTDVSIAQAMQSTTDGAAVFEKLQTLLEDVFEDHVVVESDSSS